MPTSKNEIVANLLFPELSRQRLMELANVEVVLFTDDLSYAIELQRACLRWCIDYSWQIYDQRHKSPSNRLDLALVDYDIGKDDALDLTQKIMRQNSKTPILIIGSKMLDQSYPWPKSVCGFVLKSLGTEKVIEHMIFLGNKLHHQ